MGANITYRASGRWQKKRQISDNFQRQSHSKNGWFLFLLNFAVHVFCVFLWMLQDFVELTWNSRKISEALHIIIEDVIILLHALGYWASIEDLGTPRGSFQKIRQMPLPFVNGSSPWGFALLLKIWNQVVPRLLEVLHDVSILNCVSEVLDRWWQGPQSW